MPKKLTSFLKYSIIFLIVIGWLLAGWPRIWKNPSMPPRIKQAQADTRIYNFIGVDNSNHGDGINPIAIEHDSDAFPWASSIDQNDSDYPADFEYINISSDDTNQWETDDPGRNDSMAITFRFFIQENINDISNIEIKWNGNTDDGNNILHSIYLRKDGYDEFGGTDTWIKLGGDTPINQDIDTDVIRDLTSDFPTYINAATGQFEFVVTHDDTSSDIRTNYIQLTVTYTETGGYQTSGDYISSDFDAGAPAVFNSIEWTESATGACGGLCDIRLQIKTAPDVSGAPGTWSATWCGPEGEDGDETDFFTIPAGELIHTDHNGDQWIRYKATFEGNGIDTPILEQVKINYQ